MRYKLWGFAPEGREVRRAGALADTTKEVDEYVKSFYAQFKDMKYFILFTGEGQILCEIYFDGKEISRSREQESGGI